MQRKRLAYLILELGTLIGSFSTVLAGQTDMKFFLNGRERFDVEIVIRDDVTYIPIRIVGEELGPKVNYDAATKKVTITKEDRALEIHVGEKNGLLNHKEIVLTSPIIMHITENGQPLTYIPLRNIFELFGGVVDYNIIHHFINAYNPEHIAYKEVKDLKSDDLTTYRFAQLSLPRFDGEDMYPGGNSDQYIFPLNQKVNYFLIGSHPSFDAPITTLGYYEVEDSVAICKWYKSVRSGGEEIPNPQDTLFNKYLREGSIEAEVGELPEIKETAFISFSSNSMIEPDPGEPLEPYKTQFKFNVRLLTYEGMAPIPEGIAHEYPIRNPYMYTYESSSGSLYTPTYKYFINEHLLARVDEASIKY